VSILVRIPPGLILILAFLFILAADSYSGSLEDLESLPYLAWSDKPDTRPSGVVKYNKNKAFDGYNLYTDGLNHVYLIDMTGKLVYSWELNSAQGAIWVYASLLKDGGIVAVSLTGGIVKATVHSRLIWRAQLSANHDIEILPDRTFLVPTVDLPVRYQDRCVIFDSIVHLSKEGKILDKWSTYNHLKDLQKFHRPSLLDGNKGENKPDDMENWSHPQREIGMHFREGQCAEWGHEKWYEYYHLNSIQTLPETVLGLKDKRFRKGNWLICFRNVDLICILDEDTHRVVWSWGPGILDGPHMPRMLGNGYILIFDNGYHRLYSRLLIIDPVTGKIVWEYQANPPQYFYSKRRGSSQQLPNGNFFICESMKGRAFEITPQGEIVWEFLNPKLDKNGRRRTIYRMIRIPKEEVSGWLGGEGNREL